MVAGLASGADRLATVSGRELCLSAVAVRDIDKARAAGIPESVMTDAPAHVVADPEIDVVVELMGGLEPARTLISAALAAGKPVVTANKAVIAAFGAELESISRRTGAALRFEAAVGGGIPVLGPLATDLAGNELWAIRGIVNGTTNLILSAMAADGWSYEEALRVAQEMGYAEADPRGDVEGDDAANKLVILVRLGFGAWIDPAAIVRSAPTVDGIARPGITAVTAQDMAAAAKLGYTIKLLASAERRADGVSAGVLPTAVHAAREFGVTDGVTNRIEINGEPLGTVGFSGPGAGGPATSSAVLADLIAVAQGDGSTWDGLPAPAGQMDVVYDPTSEIHEWLARASDGEPIQTTIGRLISLDAARRSLKSRVDPGTTLYPILG